MENGISFACFMRNGSNSLKKLNCSFCCKMNFPTMFIKFSNIMLKLCPITSNWTQSICRKIVKKFTFFSHKFIQYLYINFHSKKNYFIRLLLLCRNKSMEHFYLKLDCSLLFSIVISCVAFSRVSSPHCGVYKKQHDTRVIGNAHWVQYVDTSIEIRNGLWLYCGTLNANNRPSALRYF